VGPGEKEGHELDIIVEELICSELSSIHEAEKSFPQISTTLSSNPRNLIRKNNSENFRLPGGEQTQKSHKLTQIKRWLEDLSNFSPYLIDRVHSSLEVIFEDIRSPSFTPKYDDE